MKSARIKELTTCKNTSLKEIRKNLLLAGFEINRDSEEDFSTGWKQTASYANERTYRRIAVVLSKNKLISFMVRVRTVTTSSENIGSISTTHSTNKSGFEKKSTIGFGREVEDKEDLDEEYYEEYEEDYIRTQREVCGLTQNH